MNRNIDLESQQNRSHLNLDRTIHLTPEQLTTDRFRTTNHNTNQPTDHEQLVRRKIRRITQLGGLYSPDHQKKGVALPAKAKWKSYTNAGSIKHKTLLKILQPLDYKKLLQQKIIAIKHALYFVKILLSAKDGHKKRVVLEPQFMRVEVLFFGNVVTLPFPLNPEEDLVCHIWSKFVFLMLGMSSCFTPLSICFAISGSYDDWFVFDLVMDIFFTFNILYTFLCAYHNQNQQLKWTFTEIVTNYLSGWFAIDILCVLPYELMMRGIPDYSSILRGMKAVKLIRVVKLIKMSQQNLNGEVKSRCSCLKNMLTIPLVYRKILQLVLLLLYLNHLATTLFIFLISFDQGYQNWVATQNTLLDYQSHTGIYLNVYYWTFSTLVLIGYGDIIPVTDMEYTFSVIWLFVGVLAYSIVLEQLGEVFLTQDQSNQLRKQFATFETMCHRFQMSEELLKPVLGFIEENNEKRTMNSIDPLTQQLPNSLYCDVLFYTSHKEIKKIALFQRNIHFISPLLPRMMHFTVPVDTIIYRQGDPSDEVYFIMSGSVTYVDRQGRVYMKISSGYLFGEMEVLEFSTRLAFAVCTELTKLLICKADVFLKSLDTYPDILVEVVTFNRCEVDEIHKNRKQFFLEKRIEIKSSARITKLPMRTLHMVTRGSASRQIQSCKEFSRWKIEEIVDSKFSRRMKRLQVTPVNSMLTAKRILRKQATQMCPIIQMY